MRALKVVGVVVGVVAIGASAGALLAPAAAATATTAATAGGFLGMSAATLGTIATAASLAGAAIGAGMALFAPKPSFSTQGNPLAFQTNPQSGLPYPIGRTRMSGLRIHAETYDAPSFKSESKDDVLAFAVMLGAGGPMDAIETFRADKVATTFDATSGAATSGFSGDYMAQKVSLGLAGASALALTFGGVAFPGWTTDHKLSGIAHALWDLRYDPKGNTYGAGVPEPEWIGRWVKVYDPRLDSTYPGGSGSHRALDESTYAWSANPALHALTWCLGRWQNSKRTLGIGAPVANIRVADFVEAANIADANNWTCGGVEWSTDSKWSILKRMLQAAGAEPTMTGAMIGCRVNAPRVSAATVTADDLLDELNFSTTRSRRDRFNTVIPRYRSEEHDWQVISGDPISVAEYVTEDGGVRTKEIDFPLVQAEVANAGHDQAGQLAAYEIVNSREAGPIRFATGPKFIGIKTGDVVTIDLPDEGLDAQPVLIRSRSIDPATLKITFEAETETDSKHAFALGKTSVPPPTWTPLAPDLTPPTPSALLWSLTPGYDDAAVLPAVTIAGACEFPGADSVIIEYRAVGAPDWLSCGKFEASAAIAHIVSGLEGETDYEARLAYQSGARTGSWLELGPATTPAVATPPPGADAKIVTLASDRNNFVFDAFGAIVAGQTANLTVNRQNTATSNTVIRLLALTTSGSEVALDPGDGTSGYLVGSGTRTNNSPDANAFTQTGTTLSMTGANFSTIMGLSATYVGVKITATCDSLTSSVSVFKQTDGSLGYSAYVTAPEVVVDLDGDGNPVPGGYTGATGSFKVFKLDGTDISSSFTLSTDSNPASLTVGYASQTYSITGGFIGSESPATLTITATGGGSYAGVIIKRAVTVRGIYKTITLDTITGFDNQNNRNAAALNAVSWQGTPITYKDNNDGSVDLTAHFAWNAAGPPVQTEADFDFFRVHLYAATADEGARVQDFALQATGHNDIYIDPDGVNVYTVGETTVYRFVMRVPGRIETAEYVSSYNSTTQTDACRGIAFSTDGTKMYLFDDPGTTVKVFQYTLSTAWDITTATYASKTINIGSLLENAGGITFKPDGTKMYVCGWWAAVSSPYLYQYTLSTPWDLATAGSAVSKDISSFVTGPTGIAISPDGTNFYFSSNYVSGGGTNFLVRTTLATAWNLSSVMSAGSTWNMDNIFEGAKAGLAMTADEKTFYILNDADDFCRQYSWATARNFTSTRTSPALAPGTRGVAYTFGTTPTRENHYYAARNGRSYTIRGLPKDGYYTLGVEAVRSVDADIDASGEIASNFAQPSGYGYTPFRPGPITNFNGNVGDVPAFILGNAIDPVTGWANLGIINLAEWEEQSGTLILNNETYGLSPINDDITVDGNKVRLTIVLPFYVSVSNPNVGDEYYFDIKGWLYNGSTYTYFPGASGSATTDAIRVFKRWVGASASGTQTTERVIATLEMALEIDGVIEPGDYTYGYAITVPSGWSIYLPYFRYTRIENMRGVE